MPSAGACFGSGAGVTVPCPGMAWSTSSLLSRRTSMITTSAAFHTCSALLGPSIGLLITSQTCLRRRPRWQVPRIASISLRAWSAGSATGKPSIGGFDFLHLPCAWPDQIPRVDHWRNWRQAGGFRWRKRYARLWCLPTAPNSYGAGRPWFVKTSGPSRFRHRLYLPAVLARDSPEGASDAVFPA